MRISLSLSFSTDNLCFVVRLNSQKRKKSLWGKSYKFVLCSRLARRQFSSYEPCAQTQLKNANTFPKWQQIEARLGAWRLIGIFMHWLHTRGCLIVAFSDTSESISFFSLRFVLKAFAAPFFSSCSHLTFRTRQNLPNTVYTLSDFVYCFCLHLFTESLLYLNNFLLVPTHGLLFQSTQLRWSITQLFIFSTKITFESYPLLIELFSFQLILISF